jgi:hypothetical protein
MRATYKDEKKLKNNVGLCPYIPFMLGVGGIGVYSLKVQRFSLYIIIATK